MTTDAANVGGPMRIVGTTYVSRAIAIATSVPFSVGDSYFHYAESERYVDTVYLGAWWKAMLEQLGGFDETFKINEDYELNWRMRRAGGKILLSPKIRCWYYVRPSLQALARQYFRYGFWKVKTLVAHPDCLRWRQILPPALVVGLIVSAAVVAFNPILGLIVPMLYLAANVLASMWTGASRGWIYAPVLPMVYATIHLRWG